MEELLVSALGEVPDGLLGNSVLKMRVDAAEGKPLASLLAPQLEVIVGKSAMVTMVVLNCEAVLFCKLLECKFGCNSFFGRQGHHQMNVLEAQKMVNEHGCGSVPFLCEHSFRLRHKSDLR
jgi:hypothetical protein